MEAGIELNGVLADLHIPRDIHSNNRPEDSEFLRLLAPNFNKTPQSESIFSPDNGSRRCSPPSCCCCLRAHIALADLLDSVREVIGVMVTVGVEQYFQRHPQIAG